MKREPFDPDRLGSGQYSRDCAVDPKAEQLARRVIGAAIDLHKALGPGHAEKVYEEALCIELQHQQIPFTRQAPFRVTYRGQKAGEGWADLLIDNTLIVELKAVEDLIPTHSAQVVAYLRAMELQLGLLINFNVPKLKDGLKRIVL